MLNKSEKKILEELIIDSRQSNRQLARKLNLSKETIGNNVKRLMDNEIIKSFSLKINYRALGFKQYDLFIRLKKTSKEEFKKIISFLISHNNVNWIGKSFGKFDLKVTLIIKDETKINQLVANIHERFADNIEQTELLKYVDKFKVPYNNFFTEINNSKIQKMTEQDIKRTELSSQDKILLYELGNNPRETYVNLSKKINLTPEAIKYKIIQLKKQRIILGNSIVLNGIKFNKIWCLMLINISPEKIENLKNNLKTKKFLSSYIETMGVYNFNATFFSENLEQLYNSLNEIRNEHFQDIRNFDFLIFFNFFKYPKTPKCILD